MFDIKKAFCIPSSGFSFIVLSNELPAAEIPNEAIPKGPPATETAKEGIAIKTSDINLSEASPVLP